MKKTIKCPNCNTYFDIDHIYGMNITTIYCNCFNCKFPLRIKAINMDIIEVISLLSDKCYFNEVKNNFIGYTNYTNKPSMNLNF